MLRAANAHDAGCLPRIATGCGQLMLMMLALRAGWPQATGSLMLMMLAFGAGWPQTMRADVHDAGFRRRMATGYGQLMLIILAFGPRWPQATGS